MSCILGRKGTNCDGHAYFPDLGQRLGDILRGWPRYMVGLQNKGLNDLGGEFIPWLHANGLSLANFIDADVFHNANQQEGLARLWINLRDKDVVAVGPVWLRLLPAYKMTFSHVIVPHINAWLHYAEILDHVSARVKDGTLVTVSMGMGGKVLIDDLWKRNKNITILDMGSSLDCHCGIFSRKYHFNMNREYLRGDTE